MSYTKAVAGQIGPVGPSLLTPGLRGRKKLSIKELFSWKELFKENQLLLPLL